MPNPRKPLTRRQSEILRFIAEQIEKQGYAPSFEEIAKRFGFSSLATVHEHLTNLTSKGYLRRWLNESRAMELVPYQPPPDELGLLKSQVCVLQKVADDALGVVVAAKEFVIAAAAVGDDKRQWTALTKALARWDAIQSGVEAETCVGVGNQPQETE